MTPIPASIDSRTQLMSLSDSDIDEIASFIGNQSGRDRALVESHLRWFLLENPARGAQEPVGFGLRSSDQLVGCILTSPQFFRVGTEKVLLMGSSSFYVDEQHRGQGGRIFLQYCRLGRQRALLGTSANAQAAALWKAAGAYSIPYSDREFIGVLRWPPMAEELAHRRSDNRTLSRLAGSSISNVAGLFHPLKLHEHGDKLTPLTSPKEACELCIREPSPKLTASRDEAYLRWRYFFGHDSTAAVFAFRSSELDRDVFVAVNRRKRGYRGQIETLNLLDVYPEVSSQEWIRIVGALLGHYKNAIDVVVLRNLNPNLQKIFIEKGFQQRIFDAPIGWVLDKGKFLPDCDWYAVPADGDSLI